MSSTGGPSHLVSLPSDRGGLHLAIWLPKGQPLRKRVQDFRTVWDLRWHDKNRAVATESRDPKASECAICHRYWSQAHVLCDCPGTTSARTEGALDLTIAVIRLSPGSMLDLGRKFQVLLTIPNQPALMARRCELDNGTKQLLTLSAPKLQAALEGKSKPFAGT